MLNQEMRSVTMSRADMCRISVGIFVAIYGVIFGFGYWYVFIHAYN